MISRDFKRIKRLGKYLRKDKKRLGVILLIMLPVAIAGAVQPLLVGQAISVLKGEPTFSLINELSMKDSIRFLVGILLVSVLLRLGLQGYQSYNIQKVGQTLTARIRNDLFSHSMALSLKYHDSMPVGKLLTRLTKHPHHL